MGNPDNLRKIGKFDIMPEYLVITLLLVFVFLCSGFVSTNVPLDHWSYRDIDKLIGQGLIDSDITSTRPITRLEMARLIAEADEKTHRIKEKNEIILAMLDRLKKEFKAELDTVNSNGNGFAETFVKPVEDPYIRYIFGKEKPELENRRGDVFKKHSNLRMGFASRIKTLDTFAFYLHPEFSYSSHGSNDDLDVIEGYGKLSFGNFELQAGKDSLWWGPGYHGSILMSNNAQPFKMVKISNPHPAQIPGFFRGLGLFKGTWFLAELEKDRAIPEAKLTGLRFDFKPNPFFEFGMSRVIMFDGSGNPRVGLRDYINYWKIQPEQPQTNQLAGFDVSLRLPLWDTIPARTVKFYAEFIGEDEAGGLPAKWARLFGMKVNDIFKTGRTDMRIEYTNNHVAGAPNVFYTHSLYQSGYTYKGRVIGHHIGTDASDLFIRVSLLLLVLNSIEKQQGFLLHIKQPINSDSI